MKKSFTLLLLVFCFLIQAQTTYKLGNIGYITIPNEMELQKGEYKELAKEYANKQHIEIDFDNRIVFQQKGLNEFKQSSFNSNNYTRIIIETQYGSFRNDNNITAQEQKELNIILKSQLSEGLSKISGMKLLEWYGISKSNIGGKSAIKFSYKRQLNTNPPVYVVSYIIPKGNKQHLITFSYRENQKDKWQPIYNQILNSIKIN